MQFIQSVSISAHKICRYLCLKSNKSLITYLLCNMSNDNGHVRVLFEVLLKEKVLEASLRRSVKQLGIERDNAYAAMKKSQLEHTLAVAKHENVQAELRQKIVTVGLIREAWDSERAAGDVVPAGSVGGHAGINGGADNNSGTVIIDDGTVGVNGAGVGPVASAGDVVPAGGVVGHAGINGGADSNSGTVVSNETGADVGTDLDEDSAEFEALLVENLLETEAKLANMTAHEKVSDDGGNGDTGIKVKDTVNGDSPVGVNNTDIDDLGGDDTGNGDTTRKLKDICLSIPLLESPNGKPLSKRKVSHENKSINKASDNQKSTKASAKSKRVKSN